MRYDEVKGVRVRARQEWRGGAKGETKGLGSNGSGVLFARQSVDQFAHQCPLRSCCRAARKLNECVEPYVSKRARRSSSFGAILRYGASVEGRGFLAMDE